MTDLDPDVLAALRRWADATDPTQDLVGGPAIRAGATGRARWTSHRALLVAAVALVALVAAATVWAVGRDDTGRVTTDPEPAVVPDALVPLDVVVETAGLTGDPQLSRHTIDVDAACPADRACGELSGEDRLPVPDGTSLVLTAEVPDGSTWRVTISTWTCGAVNCATDADGTPPGEDAEVLLECATEIAVRGATLATIGLFGPADRPDCDASTGGPTPALTVPPAFTLRPTYPHDCSTGVGEVGGADGVPDAEAWDCLVGALSSGDPVELVVYEQGDGGPITRSWWRAGEDGGLTIIVEEGGGGRWSEVGCTALVPSVFGPEGTPGARGCGAPTELDLAYEGPTGGPLPMPPATDPVPLDLVVFHADAADVDPTAVDRWVLTGDGLPIAAGPLDASETALATWDLARTGTTTIRWERYDCGVDCPPITADGRPLEEGAVASTRCEQVIPADADQVTVRFQTVDGAPGGGVCDVIVDGDLPPLTVPPAWSLRERYGSSCGADSVAGSTPTVDDGPSPERSGCLVQAFEAGELVEMESTEGDERRIVWRVGRGGLTITRPPTATEPAWTEQMCTGLSLLTPARAPYLEPSGCGPEVPMALDPPP